MKLKSIIGIFCLAFFMISCGGDDTEKFIGTWSGDINCLGDVTELMVEITLGADDDSVLINIIDGDEPVLINATVDGDNLTMDVAQIIEGTDITELSGTGSVNSDGNLILNFNLEVFEDGDLVGSGTCLANLSM